MEYLYAGVLTGNKTDSTDRIFTYAIPDALLGSVEVGHRVMVPFGMGNKPMEGYVVELKSEIDFSPKKLKSILEVLDEKPVLTEAQVLLSERAAFDIPCRRLDLLKAMVPSINRVEIDQNRRYYYSFDHEAHLTEGQILGKNLEIRKLRGNTGLIYQFIKDHPGIDMEKIREKFRNPGSNLTHLLKKGFIKYREEEIYRRVHTIHEKEKSILLTDDQKKAISEIKDSFQRNKNVLLYGITGSGKTEVYFNLIEETLESGKSCIFLVPEIALTTQMMARVRNRFGQETAIFHSGLTEAERLDQWRLVRNGIVHLAVGPRSAVFLPFKNLGLLIIDEEHENAYKSDTAPKYDARGIADYRSQIEGCKVVRGSATPSVESFFRAEQGEWTLVELKHRIGKSVLPSTEIVDMRDELADGNRSPFSRLLVEKLKACIDQGNQAILFLNRRGHSTFVSCRDCGEPLKCPHCSVSLTYHDRGRMVCHYCAFEVEQPEKCPKCGSKRIKYFGTGTQKIQEEFERIFGRGLLVRMDADSTSKRGAHGRIIEDFGAGKYRVMLGTQMVAKGLDFPNVTLVAVLSADTMINLPDFRSGERSFQIISQVSGRAGRGEKKGEVIIQTYSPEHYAVTYGAKQDYRDFFQEEIQLRKFMDLPPYKDISIVRLHGPDPEVVLAGANEVKAQLMEEIRGKGLDVTILGPSTSTVEQVKDQYRYQILLKYEPGIRKNLPEVFHHVLKEKEPLKGVTVSVETNPYNML